MISEKVVKESAAETPPPLYILGVDLGQAQDFTALVVLELSYEDTGETESYGLPGPAIEGRVLWPTPTRPVYRRHFAARHLERLPKSTSYPKQVGRIKTLVERLIEDTGTVPKLVLDKTGVGAAVVDMVRAAGLHPTAVTITAGDRVTVDGLDVRVPKRDLVSIVQVLLQSERLKVARALPDAQTLIDELLGFKVNISLSGHASFGNDVGSWRESQHDDLVLATALGCWVGER